MGSRESSCSCCFCIGEWEFAQREMRREIYIFLSGHTATVFACAQCGNLFIGLPKTGSLNIAILNDAF